MARIVELDGKKYIWNGKQWLDEHFLIPPETVIQKLNIKSSSYFAEEDELIKDVYALISRAKKARSNKQHIRAEKLAQKILEIDPNNHSGLAILCASLRERGMPERALSETERYAFTENPALLTSRAAAYCDLGRWEEAKITIGRALAIKASSEAFSVVRRIKSACPDLYKSE